jgi:hypothetical protein
MAAPQIYIPGQAKVPVGPREHPGRKTRTTAATWVLDYLVPTNKTIVLCWKCVHKFDYKAANYFPLIQRVGYVIANCDDCKAILANCHMFTHESLLGTKHGQCWDTELL